MKKLLLSLLFIASFFGAIAQKSDATLTSDAVTNIQQAGVYNPAKAYTMFKELIDNKVNQMVTVNGHALTGNITLTASDVGAIGLSSLSAVAPIGYNTGTGAISIATANTSTTGALTNTDWNTFNGKANTSVGGDLSGLLPNPTVAKINGNTVPSNAAGALINNGSGALSWGSISSNPFADNTDILKNSSDATKIIRFNLGGLTTATTRTWTFPDVNGTFARNDAAQTFTGTQTFSSLPSFPSQTANAFLASPNGSSGTPTFRAIVAGDIPTLNQNTSGTASNLSGTPALPNGTTATTQTAGDNTTKLATTAFVTGALSTAALPAADATHDGYLTAANFNIFNAKGSVSSFAFGNLNGITGTVTNSTTTPSLSLALGNITPTGLIGASTAANQWQLGGTWTASANSQWHTNISGTITSRTTASDAITSTLINTGINMGSTGIDAVGLLVSVPINGTGGVNTTFQFSTTLAGMTATTYTNVAPASTSGSGTGALFNITATATTLSITSVPTPGTGYKQGDNIVFNGSQFGSGTGSITYYIGPVTGQNRGSNSSQIRVLDQLPSGTGYTIKLIDFQNNIAGPIGAISHLFNGTERIQFHDNAGVGFYMDGTNLFSNRNLSVAGTVLGGAASFSTGITANGYLKTLISTITTTTVLTNNFHTVLIDATSGNITVTLPLSSGSNQQEMVLKRIDSSANTVTITAAGSEKIDGTTTKSLGTQYTGYMIQNNGTQWWITSTF